jgi:hypothetical protein
MLIDYGRAGAISTSTMKNRGWIANKRRVSSQLCPASLLWRSAARWLLLKNGSGIQFVENFHKPGAIAVAQPDVGECLSPFFFALERMQDGGHLAEIGGDRFVG